MLRDILLLLVIAALALGVGQIIGLQYTSTVMVVIAVVLYFSKRGKPRFGNNSSQTKTQADTEKQAPECPVLNNILFLLACAFIVVLAWAFFNVSGKYAILILLAISIAANLSTTDKPWFGNKNSPTKAQADAEKQA